MTVMVDSFSCIPFQFLLLLVIFKCETLINQQFNMRMTYSCNSVLQLQLYIMQCRRQELSFCKSLLIVKKCFEVVGEDFQDNSD